MIEIVAVGADIDIGITGVGIQIDDRAESHLGARSSGFDGSDAAHFVLVLGGACMTPCHGAWETGATTQHVSDARFEIAGQKRRNAGGGGQTWNAAEQFSRGAARVKKASWLKAGEFLFHARNSLLRPIELGGHEDLPDFFVEGEGGERAFYPGGVELHGLLIRSLSGAGQWLRAAGKGRTLD